MWDRIRALLRSLPAADSLSRSANSLEKEAQVLIWRKMCVCVRALMMDAGGAVVCKRARAQPPSPSISFPHTSAPHPPPLQRNMDIKQQVVQEFLSQRVPLPQLFLALDQVSFTCVHVCISEDT